MAKKPSLHDLAIRLCEGQRIEIYGLVLRAVNFIGESADVCYYCEMDSICTNYDDIDNLCAECDNITRTPHLLKLC